ncbi:hypothetical protein [Paenibacillus amylolyticus]|uniref:hypothetical protein n=1 Tax=Paenibacillus amylolyticus TaxID=1451 RepID=UPI00201D2FE2|nr:hypothetical protein [Paenibacillus amylolyticus]MCL6659684.1 hypothetical protein [Paenibacillus amylolyticus]
MGKKIFENKFRNSTNIVNIGWQDNVEKELGVEGLTQFGYISGYKDAADDLVDKVLGISLADAYVFPIVFNYRQYLELVLKNLFVKIYGKNTRMDHDLSKIWGKVRDKIKGETTKEQRKFIDSVIEEFQTIDPRSFHFRYFWNIDYSPTLPNEISVDLDLLKKRINQVDSILYGSYGV